VLQHSCVDYGCVGEGEDFIVDFVRSLRGGRVDQTIAGLVYRDNGTARYNPVRHLGENLDSLPWPDKDLFLDGSHYKWRARSYWTISGRGCPYTCTYCSRSATNDLFRGAVKPLRRRAASDVVNEIKAAKEKDPRLSHVIFLDDLFTLNKSWLKEFCGLYREQVNLPFWAETHPATLDDELIEMLCSANWAHVAMGVQSTDEELRRNYFNRNHTNKKLIEVLAKLRSANAHVCVDTILQLPGQTVEDVLPQADFYIDNRVDEHNSMFLRYYAGTELTERAHKEGVLSEQQHEDILNGYTSPDVFEIEGTAVFTQDSMARAQPTDSKDMGKMRTLLTLTSYMPEKLYRLFRRYNLWRYLPGGLACDFVRIFGPYWQRLRYGKRRLTYNPGILGYAIQGFQVACVKLKFLMRSKSGS
jgi:radical SAM superfamily enzyme YgiQ (UPF0313 family)